MASGSVTAVHKMYTILRSQNHELYGITLDQIRGQFELEYGLKITPDTLRSADEWAPPTAQELEEEEDYLQQRHASARADYYRRRQ